VITFLSRLLRVLFVLLVARFVLRAVAALVYPSPQPAGRPTPGELVRDRVCNTYLPRERALVATVAGHDQHFCSARCRDLALADS
jgi:hypothetical protein